MSSEFLADIFLFSFLVFPLVVGYLLTQKNRFKKLLKNKKNRNKTIVRFLSIWFILFISAGVLLPSSPRSPEISKNIISDKSKGGGNELSSESLAEEQLQPDLETVKVSRVVDGDTIELTNGQKVRYIGIDTPETKDPRKDVECFGLEATVRNKQMVEGMDIQMEKDVSETDRYGRLLRYVYVNGVMVNDVLVREGYAEASPYPPDVKYQDWLEKSEQEARDSNKGLWGDVCNKPDPTPTSKPIIYPTIKPTTKPIYIYPTSVPKTNINTSSSYVCNCSKTCSNMSSCAEAYFQLNNCGCTRRDGDKDGIPCESICK
jgi:micrococcal nuclease